MTFAAGFVGGVLSSMPFGPINLILVDLISRRHFAKLAAFLAGVILGDTLVAAACLWGLVRVDPDPHVALALGAGCAAILLVYAVSSWRTTPRTGVPSEPASIARSAALGFSFCFFNPLFALFWLSFIAGYRELFEARPCRRRRSSPGSSSATWCGSRLSARSRSPWCGTGASVFSCACARRPRWAFSGARSS
jgi:arginine exporter protein ArgO